MVAVSSLLRLRGYVATSTRSYYRSETTDSESVLLAKDRQGGMLCAMAGNRSYGDQCGVARALDVIGERWALLVVRELLFGPRRFNDLLAGLLGASPNVISQRLRDLTGCGVISQRELGPPTRVRLYELTEWGRELEPVLLHLGQWGQRAPLPEGSQVSLNSVLLAIKASLDPARVSGPYELRIGVDSFTVDAAGGQAQFRRGTADQPSATVITDAETFRAVVFGQRSIADATRSGDLRITGSTHAAGQLSDMLLTLSPETPPFDPEPAGQPVAAVLDATGRDAQS